MHVWNSNSLLFSKGTKLMRTHNSSVEKQMLRVHKGIDLNLQHLIFFKARLNKNTETIIHQ